jgi:serine/threonine protein kinase
LADFGVTTVLFETDTHTFTASTGGTLRWMAPELLNYEEDDPESGKPTPASDMYALGMVLWEVGSYIFDYYLKHITQPKF